MSFLARLGSWRLDDGVALDATAAVQLGGGGDVAQVRHLPIAVAQAFGLGISDVVERTQAMTVPAVRRGRQVICGTLGALPLVAHRRRPDGTVEDVTDDRRLLVHPDPNTTRQHVLTWTVDDLLFRGVAWWRVLDRDAQGYPTSAERLAPHRVTVDLHAGTVRVDGEPAADRDLIRFDGPDEGVLAYGGRTLRTCLLLEDAVRRFARLDVPLGILTPAEGAPELTEDEITELLDKWEASRRDRTTAYLNRSLTYERQQFDAQQLQLADARQYQAAEVARLLNLAPRWVNAPSASGMTYTNVESERRDLADTTLVGYVAALEQRLSLGDVTPRGTTVRVDLAPLLRGDTLTALQGAQLAVQLGAMTPAEVRTDVLGRPPLPPGSAPDPMQEA